MLTTAFNNQIPHINSFMYTGANIPPGLYHENYGLRIWSTLGPNFPSLFIGVFNNYNIVDALDIVNQELIPNGVRRADGFILIDNTLFFLRHAAMVDFMSLIN